MSLPLTLNTLLRLWCRNGRLDIKIEHATFDVAQYQEVRGRPGALGSRRGPQLPDNHMTLLPLFKQCRDLANSQHPFVATQPNQCAVHGQRGGRVC